MGTRSAHVMLVLGCRVDGPGKPSAALLRRLDAALAVWQHDPTCRLVLSGGGEPSEASVMRDHLLARGVPADRLILEEKARNTRENATMGWPQVLAQLPAGAAGDHRVTVVTEAAHLGRALLVVRGVARALGPRPMPMIHGEGAPDSPHRAERWRRQGIEMLARLRERAWLWRRARGPQARRRGV